jgi:hypothetical protein
MPGKKATDVPNVNEARDKIKKRKELAQSKAVQAETRAPENATREKSPPPSPNAGVPVPDPPPEGPIRCHFIVYLHYVLDLRYYAFLKHYVYMYVVW